MKAIIIAAGKGIRLRDLTRYTPKCMLDIKGKTILERQIGTLNECGISDISVVKGYRKEKIDYPGIKYYINDDYENNNILNSLFYAEEEMDSEVIISYSDILYEDRVVRKLLDSREDISVGVNVKWREYYENRFGHPMEEAENVIFDEEKNVIEIGKILARKDDAHGEFIGMMKLSKKGTDIFKNSFHEARKLFQGKQFVRAATFENAYMTDMLQYLVNNGVNVSCVAIERGWYEIDTVEDYEKVNREFKGR